MSETIPPKDLEKVLLERLYQPLDIRTVLRMFGLVVRMIKEILLNHPNYSTKHLNVKKSVLKKGVFNSVI